MLSNIVAELITERIEASRLRLDQKFCFSVLATPPTPARDEGAGPDELNVEVMLAGSRDTLGALEYSVKVNDLTLPIDISASGLRSLLAATFTQAQVVDLAHHQPWYTVRTRLSTDYENVRTDGLKTGLLLRISG